MSWWNVIHVGHTEAPSWDAQKKENSWGGGGCLSVLYNITSFFPQKHYFNNLCSGTTETLILWNFSIFKNIENLVIFLKR